MRGERLKSLHLSQQVRDERTRILRQANDNESVHIYRYVTEGLFDAYMWQMLETKGRAPLSVPPIGRHVLIRRDALMA